MKSFDDVKPKAFDNNKWKDKVVFAELKKKNEWYQYRIVGGIHSYAVHWVETTKADGTVTRFPVDCFAYDPDLDDIDPEKTDSCPGCEAKIKSQIKYLINVIDRAEQSRGASDYIRAFELSPTAMGRIINLKKLNLVDGTPTNVASPEHGIDVYIQKTRAGNKSFDELEVQKGEKSPLTKKELAAELYDFSEIVTQGSVANARASLTRAGAFKSKDADSEDGPAPSGVSMPRSGVTQLPPSELKAQRVAKKAEPDDDGEDEEPDPAPEPIKAAAPKAVKATLPVQEDAPVASAVKSTQKPDCFGDYLGEIQCLSCPYKTPCLAS